MLNLLFFLRQASEGIELFPVEIIPKDILPFLNQKIGQKSNLY